MQRAVRICGKLEQFTEVPLSLEGVDERLAWMRTWTSWRNLTLTEFDFFHEYDRVTEAKSRSSRLISLEMVPVEPLGAAVEGEYNVLNRKINLLSLISGKGFGIISVYPIHPETQFQENKDEFFNHNETTTQSEPESTKGAPTEFPLESIAVAGRGSKDVAPETAEFHLNVAELPNVKRQIECVKLTEMEGVFLKAKE